MGTELEDRRIIFMHGNNNVLCELPFSGYEPGDIKETKERLAQELNCSPKEIEVRITGLKEQPEKKTPPKLRVVGGSNDR